MDTASITTNSPSAPSGLLRALRGQAAAGRCRAPSPRVRCSRNLDINQFLLQVDANAPATGIAQMEYSAQPVPVVVKADEHALEDAITHVLRNADGAQARAGDAY